MSGDRLARLILFSSCIWGFCLGSANLAQIVPDNTLGNESSIVVDDNALDLGQIVDLIKSGAIRGKTLFHSFEEFNVLSDRQVYFDSPKGIEQILTRVTGNNSSNILGRLGVNGNADLFLLNPNGILFGENASLDIGGSFVATTADSLVFDDDLVYSATNPETPPLLKIDIPEGIQFGADAGTIEVRGAGHTLGFDSSTLMLTGNAPSSGLKVPTGETLALIAGELNLNGANLSASEGNIELAAISQSGEVELEQDKNLFAFDYDAIDNFGDINLFQQSLLDVRGGKNLGSVSLTGNNITLQSGSAIIANKLSSGKSKTRGEIELVATDSLNIINNASGIPSGIFTQIDQSSNQPGANIQIDTDRLELQNNALIVSTVTNKGQGGNININARQIDLIDNYDLPYNAGIYSQTLASAKEKGDVGIISVEADNLQLLNGQTVISIDDDDDLKDLVGKDLAKDLKDAIEDNDDEDVNMVIGAFESGKRSLIFKGGGEITSINRGSGKDGVAIIAADTIQFFNTSEPEVPEPEISEPEVPEPEISEPEVPEPEVPEPETPDPEVPEPEVPTPEVPTPEVSEPEVSEPEVSEPEVSEPEVSEPEVSAPEVPEPEISEPEVPEPEVPEPEVSAPEVSVPEVSEPEVPAPETPDSETSDPEIPEPEIPEPEVPTPEIPDSETPDPEIPDPETSDPEILEPEIPTPEVPNISQDLESDRVYTFELSSGQTIVVNAEDLIKAAQLESTDSLTNSGNSKNKPIEIHASSVSTIRTVDPDFDIPSGCRLGNDNFVIVGKGGIAENPFNNLIQGITVPDIEEKLSQPTETISATEIDTPKQHYVPVVEAQNWKLNQSGKIELLASSSQKGMSSLADLPNCLRD